MAGTHLTSSHSKLLLKHRPRISLSRELAKLDAHQSARRLLGCELIRTVGKHQVVGRIIETESYEETDPAAHSYGGPRGRNLTMFGPAGRAYVYFTYGIHYCVNVVVGRERRGEAVLIRALEPLTGLSIMAKNRRQSDIRQLCSGPAKLTQALGIGLEFNGHDLTQLPLQLKMCPSLPASAVTVTTRIGIRHNTEHLQRFYITGSRFISKL